MHGTVERPVVEGLWQSRTAGDIVLASTPPYMLGGWLPMGIPLIGALLEQDGITSRVVRFQDAPSNPPPQIVDLVYDTLYRDPSIDSRLSRIRQIADGDGEFFNLILTRLLAGPERVFGLSAWRMNADVTLEIARRLKEQRPDALVIVGGPEASEGTSDFFQDWIDVVVWGSAESVVVSVIRAMLDRRPGEAAAWTNVWVNPKHARADRSPLPPPEQPPIPRIDYTTLVPLQVGAANPSLPLMLNLGCPFRCGFCPNTTIYPEMGWGSPQRVVDEMVEIMRIWAELHPPGEAPQIELQLCDAALNGNPGQFDQLCDAMIAADWPIRPSVGTLLVIDKRMTRERSERTIAAGLHHAFFGLESANPRLRRLMKKPGKKEEIAVALRVCRDAGFDRSLGMGIIVGWPDETEEEFYETVEFLDWSLGLGVINSVTVTPLIRTPGMMDPTLMEGAAGEARGLLWQMPTPGGSPNVRARRVFHAIDHFRGLVPVSSSIPHEIIAKSMLNPGTEVFWDGWHARNTVDDAGAARQLVANASGDAKDDANPLVETMASETDSTADGGVVTPPHAAQDAHVANGNGGIHGEPVDVHVSERTLVGRGESIVLRLDRTPGALGFARVGDHALSYIGSDIPAPLRTVVLSVGRVVRELPTAPDAADEAWGAIARIVENLAPDINLVD